LDLALLKLTRVQGRVDDDAAGSIESVLVHPYGHDARRKSTAPMS
jgi:hypothetical protein